MTTKEFIEMLQKEDPSGEAHIRMDGGVPEFCELKPGYYDGAYNYIDKDGKYVSTTQGMKVDIYCTEPSTYIWDNYMEWNEFQEDPELGWERLKTWFRFEYGNMISGYEDREAGFFKKLRKDFDEYVQFAIDSRKKYVDDVLEKHSNGWKFMQKKEPKMKFYDWNIVKPDGKNDGANWATTGPILLSGKFEAIDRGEFLEWIPKARDD